MYKPYLTEQQVSELLQITKYNAKEYAPADMVEVVRCQNCKYSAEWERGLWCTWHGDMYARENYFCADGKRKDEE